MANVINAIIKAIKETIGFLRDVSPLKYGDPNNPKTYGEFKSDTHKNRNHNETTDTKEYK
jgi:hypothetical protein